MPQATTPSSRLVSTDARVPTLTATIGMRTPSPFPCRRVLQGAGDATATAPGLYVCGWLKRGPSGIIGSNLVCAQETVQCVAADLEAGVLPRHTNTTDGLLEVLKARGVNVVDRDGWARIDGKEVADGAVKDKPREKLTCTEQLLSVGGQREAS